MIGTAESMHFRFAMTLDFKISMREGENFMNREIERMEKGHNVRLEAFFRVRFEPKRDEKGVPTDELSEESLSKLEEATVNYPAYKDGVKGKSGIQQRTQESRDIILDKLGEKKYSRRKLNILHLPIPLKSGTIPKDFYAKMYAERPELKGDASGKRTGRIEYILATPREDADKYKFLVGDEAASVLAYLADRYIKMSGRLKNESKIGIENVTHGITPEAFLKEVAIKDDGSHIESLSEFCDEKNPEGALSGGEAVRLSVKRDEHGEASASIIFRGKEYNIDMERLAQLADLYKTKTKEKLAEWNKPEEEKDEKIG